VLAAAEFAFIDGDWLGDTPPPDSFAPSVLGLAGLGVAAAAVFWGPDELVTAGPVLEDGPEVSLCAATAIPG
jgi:hypothetical protein